VADYTATLSFVSGQPNYQRFLQMVTRDIVVGTSKNRFPSRIAPPETIMVSLSILD
jgi:hypothetical protein